MLKHVSNTTLNRRRGVSPAPSSASISTLESSGSSSSGSSSTCSSPSASLSSGGDGEHHGIIMSNGHGHGHHELSSSSSSSSFSWRSLSDCRTSSRLSMTENPNAVPLRVYAAVLRADIQYKTIGVTSTTTCEEVIGALLSKCKVRFKDPRLFQLSMEVQIRCPDGYNTRGSVKLEDQAIPLQLQECYPRGQARFILEIRQGTLVKIYDGSHTVGWEYKSLLISDKTTATELLDILFRFTPKNLHDIHFYTIHLEVKDWRRPLGWDEMILPAKDAATRNSCPDEVKILLRSQAAQNPFMLPSSIFLRTSTLSLYDNVSLPRHHPNNNNTILLKYPPQSLSQKPLETTTLGRFHSRLRRQRSKSFSDSLTSSSPVSSISGDSIRLLEGSNFQQHPTLTQSVIATLNKLSAARHGKYELSEAFFV